MAKENINFRIDKPEFSETHWLYIFILLDMRSVGCLQNDSQSNISRHEIVPISIISRVTARMKCLRFIIVPGSA